MNVYMDCDARDVVGNAEWRLWHGFYGSRGEGHYCFLFRAGSRGLICDGGLVRGASLYLGGFASWGCVGRP